MRSRFQFYRLAAFASENDETCTKWGWLCMQRMNVHVVVCDFKIYDNMHLVKTIIVIIIFIFILL